MQALLQFLQNLYAIRKQRVTVLVLDASRPEDPISQEIVPQKVVWSAIVLFLIFLAFVLSIIFFTPVGTLVIGTTGRDLLLNVQQLNDRVAALKDSIDHRDRQLRAIQGVIVKGIDTTFAINNALVAAGVPDPEPELDESIEQQDTPTRTMNFSMDDADPVPTDSVFAINGLPGEEDEAWPGASPAFFPAEAPVSGRYSRVFSIDKKHFGLDIAAQEGAPVKALANGVVLLAEWTINYGYVIYIQHPDGWVSGFKHCSSLSRKAGDIISARDIVGTAGNTGLISSGPHLHVEIWHHGVPVDPEKLLVKQ